MSAPSGGPPPGTSPEPAPGPAPTPSLAASPKAVVKTIEVSVDAEHAFRVWTERIDLWWPKVGHSVGGQVETRMAFEGTEGGRFVERTPDGREIEWGVILVWEPPSRLVHSWELGTDEQGSADVEITFIEIDAGRTRVTVEHRAASMAPELWKKLAKDFSKGWEDVLRAFQAYED